MVSSMQPALAVAKLLLPAAAVVLALSLQAVTNDVAKAWRCRPDPLATDYEWADACRSGSWR